jgi:serine/threonine-protein kinase PknG
MDRERCKQTGCDGLLEDGYCNICGLSAAKPVPAAPVAPTRPSSIATSTGSTPLSRAAFGSRSSRRISSHGSRKHLGADLVTLPDLPSTDPEKAVMLEARVPENKRFCCHCDYKLSREKGFCGQCGRRYSFLATLQPGEVIAAQYEVKGALAFGGLGWIYLAFDRLLSRYVVLKGLLNTEDAAAAAVAVAERQFLAAVRHPNIVGIYNFVQLDTEGFIVMEYVGGQTLRDVRRKRGPLPAAESLAYIHRILGAFSYLHRMGLVYCDFKPENVMLECDDVKLIDLGGVRRLEDPKGDIYGTVGYSAPEANEGPTVESDLFTIGRTLAVLLTDIRGFGKDHRYSLPGPDEEPLFARQESLYRFLLKATALNPSDRFESADAMADQLLGVLREVVATETGIARPGPSNLFGGDLLAITLPHYLDSIGADYRQLPVPLIDSADPASSLVRDAAALPTSELRVAALRQLTRQTPASTEAWLRFANCLTDAGNDDEAAEVLAKLEAADPWDWRAPWMRGRLLLARRKPLEAQAVFDQVYFDLPGELAPKLAFAMAAEQAGNWKIASAMYDLVSRTDPHFSSACFGLARCLSELGDRRGSVAALNRIPPESNLHVCSRVEATRAMIRNGRSVPGLEELASASAALEELSVDGIERHRLAGQVFATALKLLVTRQVKPSSSVRVLGYPVKEFHMRQGLEQSLRAVAHVAVGEEKIRLVEEANRVRPRTLF